MSMPYGPINPYEMERYLPAATSNIDPYTLPGFNPKGVLYDNNNMNWNLDNIMGGIGKYGSYAKTIFDLFKGGREILGLGPEDKSRKMLEDMLKWQQNQYTQAVARADADKQRYYQDRQGSRQSFFG